MKQAEEMHCNVGFLGQQLFSATVVQFKSNDVIRAIKKAMKHDFVVGAYNIGSHWVMVAIAMKWNVVCYLDSSKGFPLRKFKDVVTVVNWYVYSRFCSQKFHLLMFLINIAGHAGPFQSTWILR